MSFQLWQYGRVCVIVRPPIISPNVSSAWSWILDLSLFHPAHHMVSHNSSHDLRASPFSMSRARHNTCRHPCEHKCSINRVEADKKTIEKLFFGDKVRNLLNKFLIKKDKFLFTSSPDCGRWVFCVHLRGVSCIHLWLMRPIKVHPHTSDAWSSGKGNVKVRLSHNRPSRHVRKYYPNFMRHDKLSSSLVGRVASSRERDGERTKAKTNRKKFFSLSCFFILRE